MSQLFKPITLGGVTLSNRVLIAPMCQYSAQEGLIQPWHWQHLGTLAISGAGAVIVEATGVEAIGRITLGDTGLWNEDQEAAFKTLIADIHSYSNVPIGIQLAHAGRKASTNKPWIERGGPLSAPDGAWTTAAPSPVPFTEGWHTPKALDEADMARIRTAFVESAKRADRAGFDIVELHGAHGYLFSEFLSPISNIRTDAYGGGSLENRMRFPLEVAEAVRAVWPKQKALGMRLNGSDWVEGGVTPDEAAEMSKRLKALGFDYVHISSGGNVASAQIPGRDPGYQVGFAERVKKANPDLVVIAVGMIAGAHQAEAVLANGKADMIAIARAVLDDPRWPHHAAEALDARAAQTESPWPAQYARAAGAAWAGRALRDFG